MRNLILKGLTSLLISLLSFIASLVILSGQSLDWKTNLLYALAILLASGILLEMFFVFSYAFKEGSYISVSSLLNREQSYYARELADGEKKCLAWIDVHFSHPYLSFVHSEKFSWAHKTFDGPNNAGFCGPDFPDEKIEDRYLILLTGGSVSSSLGQIFKWKSRFLEEVLNEQYVTVLMEKNPES
jgi:hypothetical protein